MNIKNIIYLSVILSFTFFNFLPKNVEAQNTLGLSISPPIFELMVKPGKEFKTLFTLTNLGGDTIVTPKIVYFNPADEFGNVELSQDEAPDWVNYDKSSFNLKSQGKIDFEVMFSPPTDAFEIDHFLTLVFETNEPVDLLGQNSSTYRSRIGTNILLTVSKDGNPKKSAEILEFSSPKVIDSIFGQIKYQVRIKNNGNSFWKPNGKIITEGIGIKSALKLSPLNVLSNFSRNISCIEDENLVDCKLHKQFLIGNYKSTLEFSLDEEPEIYTEEIFIFAFPFSITIIVGIIIFSSLKIYVNRQRVFSKRKNL